MASKQITWTGQVASFDMELTVGDTPSTSRVYTIAVKLDCNASFEVTRQYIAGGQSGRVSMQATMRTLDREVLEELETTGLTINIARIKDKAAYLSETAQLAILRRTIMSWPEHLRGNLLKELEEKND